MDSSRNSKDVSLTVHIPMWAAKVYIVLAVALIPWTVYLAFSLPRHHLSANWDISWTGLDVALIASLAATGVFAYRKSALIIMSAVSTGSFLLVDAWFDVLSAHSSAGLEQALIFACLVEVPLAILSYYLAGRTIHHHIRDQAHTG